MSKTQTAKQPSIEDLLASIRQAIHDDVAPADRPVSSNDRPAVVPAGRPAAASGPPRNDRASTRDGDAAAAPSAPTAAPPSTKRTVVTSARDGFAGLLGGDVRLEEALARLSHAGRRADPEPAGQVAAAVGPGAAKPRLRPSIDEPVERLQGRNATPRQGADDRLAVPPDPRHGRSEPESPPWLRPEPAEPAEPAQGSAPPVADPLWGDGEDEPVHQAHRSLARRPEDSSGQPGAPDLLSAKAAAAATSAFNRLADAIVERSTDGERSLEDVTRELLRPMLKNWLDENLPRMVEQLVREEIERVARKGK